MQVIQNSEKRNAEPTWQGIVVSDKGLLALLVGGLVRLLQILHLLLGNVRLLEVVSKGGHRDVLVLGLASEVLLQYHAQT